MCVCVCVSVCASGTSVYVLCVSVLEIKLWDGLLLFTMVKHEKSATV